MSTFKSLGFVLGNRLTNEQVINCFAGPNVNKYDVLDPIMDHDDDGLERMRCTNCVDFMDIKKTETVVVGETTLVVMQMECSKSNCAEYGTLLLQQQK